LNAARPKIQYGELVLSALTERVDERSGLAFVAHVPRDSERSGADKIFD